jgi:hypothetical protein
MGATVFIVLIAAVLVGSVGWAAPRWQGHGLVVAGALFDLLALLLIVYAVMEDDYRDVGVSRWSTYGGAAQAFTVAAVATSLLAAAIASVAVVRRKWAAALPVASLTAGLLAYFMLASMTN